MRFIIWTIWCFLLLDWSLTYTCNYLRGRKFLWIGWNSNLMINKQHFLVFCMKLSLFNLSDDLLLNFSVSVLRDMDDLILWFSNANCYSRWRTQPPLTNRFNDILGLDVEISERNEFFSFIVNAFHLIERQHAERSSKTFMADKETSNHNRKGISKGSRMRESGLS